MSTAFMRIDGNDTIKGAATVENVGGKKGLFTIASVQWGVGRPIYIAVGSASHADTGQISVSDVTVSRQCDGASALLQTFIFNPGDKGKTVEILLTKTDRKGDGIVPSTIITLEGARMSSYSLTGGDGVASESLSLAYTTVGITHYVEDATGKVEKGDTVKFDLATAKMTSGAALK